MLKRSISAIIVTGLIGLISTHTYAGDADGGSSAYVPPTSTDVYISPELSGFGQPLGQVNVVPGIEGMTTSVSATPAAIPTDNRNLLGCGGIGQGEFTSAVYNMPESFGKFQTDVNSLLARQILSLNYVMPQSAALFDQLNNYGNQRYQIFQNGCDLDSLKKDAKNQYLNTCVARLTPDRVTIIRQNLAGTARPSEDQIRAQAYAQAWEICSNQYVSDSNVYRMFTDNNTAFANQLRRAENVTAAITPLLCPPSPTAAGAAPTAQGCWASLLIPQVRLCLDPSLGCSDTNGYKVNEPLLNAQRFLDTMRFIVDDTVISKRAISFTTDVYRKIKPPIIEQSAKEASLNLGRANLGRVSQPDATEPIMGDVALGTIYDSVRDYQLNYLNCKDPNIMTPLIFFRDRLTDRTGGSSLDARDDAAAQRPSFDQLIIDDYMPIIDRLALRDLSGNEIAEVDRTALREVVWVSLGCAANQEVPMFDPRVIASLTTTCTEDIPSFYMMAGNDTAIAATRNVYRYLNLRLKQAYARLMVEGVVPSATITTGTGAPPPTISPELTNRMAMVVKEVMIPYVESQLARMDEAEKTRGEFGRKVRQIYSARQGCISKPSLF